MAAQLIDTEFGKIIVAELEDGAVKSMSAETAVLELRYVIDVPDLPDDYDWTPLMVILEYMKELAEMTPDPAEESASN